MSLDNRILEMIKNYMGKLVHKKVLKTMEEVEANTNETNLVAAQVVAELSNKLAGFEPICDATGKITGYKTDVGGADTVFPFSNFSLPCSLICQYSSNGDSIFSLDKNGSFETIGNYTNSNNYNVPFDDLGFIYYRYTNYTSKIISTRELYYSKISCGSYGTRSIKKYKIPKGAEIQINTNQDYTSVHMFSFG